MRIKMIIIVLMTILVGYPVYSRNNRLKKYKSRRDFTKTPEPQGRVTKKEKPALLFVIQKHAARALHYDFRLEINGVLKSWAVPKGPSTDPREKRLAVPTEDHPMAYAQFEGVIPKGEYGAGPVLIWDIGTYSNIKEKNGKPVSMNECLKSGKLEIFLEGKKLKGGYALIRTDGDQERWLLIKMRDEYADARKNPVRSQLRSAVSDRTMKQILDEEKEK